MTYEIDPQALTKVLRLGGPQLLARLVETALGNLHTRRGELAAALAAAEATAAERAAHSIKSSARNLGAEGLAALAERAETLARDAAGDASAAWPAAARELLAAADLDALRAALEPACQALTHAAAAPGPVAQPGSRG